ncbi:MAG: hypothetical protein ACMUEM_04840 [Flavobacteriales bacterium AspAUS03]
MEIKFARKVQVYIKNAQGFEKGILLYEGLKKIEKIVTSPTGEKILSLWYNVLL